VFLVRDAQYRLQVASERRLTGKTATETTLTAAGATRTFAGPIISMSADLQVCRAAGLKACATHN
jgi:hypothetical protein